MMLFAGVLLMAATLLLYGHGLLTFRRPGAPAWTGSYLGEVYAILLLVMAVFGVALILKAVLELDDRPTGLVGPLASLVTVIVTGILWSRLRVRERLRDWDPEADEGGAVVRLDPDLDRPQPAGRGGAPTRRGRRRAA